MFTSRALHCIILVVHYACISSLIFENISHVFNWGLANTTVTLSAMSYCTNNDRKKYDGHTFGFKETLTIYNQKFDIHGYVGYRSFDQTIYIVFRGSYSLVNWLDDLDFYTIPYPKCTACRVHQGFFEAEQSIIEELIAHIFLLKEKLPNFRVIVTGHSLGGAVATLAAADIMNAGIIAFIFNFGSPRIGNSALASYLSELLPQINRVTHYKDVVPHLPTVPQGFVHVTGEWYEDLDGSIQSCRGSEDPTCSDQWTVAVDIIDHLIYLGVYMACPLLNVTKVYVDGFLSNGRS